ncbi:gamma-glutamyl-gamma-aminobutyrate hydrolase family protein [Vibrio sp. SCSIO 43136]|uniref:gamma-glutamyl-gamma-aminobutyrate hydrolase family protein n=1 Tax=Vibrio sp. SCSIO 43136 TaxID=2819101 RepID=UPI0020752400|nr:gamma-glutamyl-gamma-aminobutyrate hydrolase family protein [Vibrio sp. SCSIO 43136]USD67887.1 gamma-glutamyl-gamma-aminobutyrate hydrolase family protein [Vibrio sp. SCSIO 43136]
MKPIIGVTTVTHKYERGTLTKVNTNFANAITKGGGVPLHIPILKTREQARDILSAVDALVISGGDESVHPMFYGQPYSKHHVCCYPERDEWEILLVREAAEMGVPMMGICRGMQLLNVAFGGDLVSNLHNEIDGVNGHWGGNIDMSFAVHTLKLEKDSIMQEVFGQENIMVNSFHNQVVKNFGEGFKPTAWAEDGLVEAFENVNHNYTVGVQWHPEAMVDRHENMIKLFARLANEGTKLKKARLEKECALAD